MTFTDLTAPAATPTVDALTQALYPEGPAVHRPWADLIASPTFRHRNGLSHTEAIELAYQRLRRINDLVKDPLALAADPVRLAAMHEWTAIADGRVAALAGIHFNLYLGSLADADSDSGRALDDALAMRVVGTCLITEVGHGSDAAALETTATRDPVSGGFLLHTPSHSAAKFMPNTSLLGGLKAAVVAARLICEGADQGVFLFHVPLSDATGLLPGVHVSELPEGTGPIDHCLTSFESVSLPAHALLEGEHGSISGNGTISSNVANPRRRFLHAIRRVTPGKLCMSALSCGISRAALAIAVHYAHHRHVSGTGGSTIPLSAHRSHHARLIGPLAATYALTLLHRTVVHAWASADDGQRQALERDVALLKARATWTAQDIVLEARECCGAHGLPPAAGFARWIKPLQGAITAEGDNRAIMSKAASELMFGGRPPQEPTASVISLAPRTAPLRDLRQLLAIAEDVAADRARARLACSPGADRLDRWNASCLPALEAADAHTSGMAADAFIAAIDKCAEPQPKRLLADLCRLYLLQELTQYTGPLQASGHLDATSARQWPDAVEAVMEALLPHMLTLTDAWMLNSYLASVPLAHATYEQTYDDPGAHWNNGVVDTVTEQDAA
ncbi:acyl-CoA dehydrogenase [Streptomyces lydicus]|uniref:acyl-CoA dehydrogenase family protein n=1 Tax=Streptomyces lydicus TaxID=47763 RepID=UPI0036FAC4F3